MKTILAISIFAINAFSQTVTVNIDPTTTYLPVVGDPTGPAISIDLAANGIVAGDTISVVSAGNYEAIPGFGETGSGLAAVFSDGSNFLAPGAGSTVVFPFTTEVADIPNDFFVQLTPMNVVVPAGATEILFTVNDTFISDNVDSDNDLTATIHVIGGNNAPTLTTVNTIEGVRANTPFSISFEDLLAATDANDVDGDTLSLVIDQVLNGSAKIDGTPIAAGDTFSAGQTLTFTSATAGQIDAFSVVATDGDLESASAVNVTFNVKTVNLRKIKKLERKIKRSERRIKLYKKILKKLLKRVKHPRLRAKITKRIQRKIKREENRIQKLEARIQQLLGC